MNANFQLPKIYNSCAYPQQQTGYRTIKVDAKPYGFRVVRFSNYISMQYIKIVYSENGFSKATVKVDTNYRSKYQYTLYFDNAGNEIKVGDTNSTRLERAKWLSMQN